MAEKRECAAILCNLSYLIFSLPCRERDRLVSSPVKHDARQSDDLVDGDGDTFTTQMTSAMARGMRGMKINQKDAESG